MNKCLDFPLTSKTNEDGVRDFINEMDNDIICIDKVGLAYLIATFHEAYFGIIDGYYYNDCRNETIYHVIEYLYNLRLKLKQEENTRIVIKRLMNSMYGKTIIKPIETYTTVKDNQYDFENYISYNYNYIGSVLEVNGRYFIKKVK